MRHPKLKIHQTSWGKGKLQVNLSTAAMSFTVKTSFAILWDITITSPIKM
jgi:hypothetical protein